MFVINKCTGRVKRTNGVIEKLKKATETKALPRRIGCVIEAREHMRSSVEIVESWLREIRFEVSSCGMGEDD